MPSCRGLLGTVRAGRRLPSVKAHHPRPLNSPDDPSSQNDCFFLKLPGELRNEIYAYLMYQHLPKIRVQYCSSIQEINNRVFAPSIFKVNKQVRAESISLLCATINFEAVGITQASVLMESVGQPGRQSLRNLTVIVAQNMYSIRALEEARFFVLLQQLTSLKHLTVKFSSKWTRETHDPDLQDFFRRLREVMQGRGDVAYLELNRSWN